MKKITFLFLWFCSLVASAQCDVETTIVVCDMETIDFDGDGNPDGIVNLYDLYFDETGNNLDPGTWSVESSLSLPLDSSTGQVSLWEYKFASIHPDLWEDPNEPEPNYVFTLSTASCGSDPAITINLELGPYSGVALPPSGTTDVNFEVCEGAVNLYESLVSNDIIPPPHVNGIWQVVEPLPTNYDFFELDSDEGIFITEITYQEGLPLVDKALFEFRYVVPGSESCVEDFTTVKVSVVRQVDSGTPIDLLICESDILNGAFDSDINLRDDDYLLSEDEEGLWSSSDNDYTNEISDGLDSIINIRDLYDALIVNNGSPRFNSEIFSFTYSVSQRSAVCGDARSTINVIIDEFIRPFAQNTDDNTICLNEATETTSINVFNFIEFTDGFNYTNGNWTTISSPTPPANRDFSFNENTGILNLFQDGAYISPGIYVFEYEVETNICPDVSANITIEVLDFNYAGEDAGNIDICEAEESVILTSLLGVDDLRGSIVTTGTWTNNADGAIVDNDFQLPEVDQDTDYTFTYRTTNTASGCEDEAILSFTIVNESPAGSSGTPITDDGVIKVCSDNLNITLFDQLENADVTGTWTGPTAYASADHLGEFIFNDLTLPRLVAGDYIYTVESNDFCVITQTTTITIEFVDPISFDEPIEETFCKSEANVDLSSLLGAEIPRTGVYTELDTSGVLTGSVVDFSTLISETYTFEYTLDNEPCGTPVQQFLITVIDDSAPLSAGIGPTEPILVCEDNRTINLFDFLEGSPATIGTWTGPFTYVSANHIGEFNQNNENLPILGEGVYTYTIDGGVCNVEVVPPSSTVEIVFVSPIALGSDIFDSFCKIDNSVNLFSLLDQNTTREGTFTALDTDQSVIDIDGNLSFETLSNDIYNFEYSVPNVAPCDISTLNIEITIFEVEPPLLESAEFCILNAATLSDIEFENTDVSDVIFYESLISENPVDENSVLQDEDIFYASLQDANGCESERTEIQVSVFNIGEDSECTIEFQDGVSANGDMTNDTFALNWSNEMHNVASAFPEYELEIYNRYGVIVFKGNANIEEFNGTSNVSLSIGSDLPSGTYFYIFKPNVLNNLPVQGSFYLSK